MSEEEMIDNSLYKLYNLLDEAQRSNAWQVLGFPSWTAYEQTRAAFRALREWGAS